MAHICKAPPPVPSPTLTSAFITEKVETQISETQPTSPK